MKYANHQADRQYSGVESSDWGAANVWISSAECARKTGVWLAICDNNRYFPIANFALADDPGHAFLLGLTARFTNRSMSLLDVARLNVKINFIGMLAIAALLFAARCEIASLVVLMLGFVPYFSWVEVSPHSGLIGAASMAAIFPLTILLGGLGFLPKRSHALFLIMGAALLGVATMIREPIGTMGFVLSLASVAYLVWSKRNRSQVLLQLGLLLLALAAWQVPRGLVVARDAMYLVQPSPYIQSHGTSHNLFIGLGAAGDNKFGIRWDDSYAAAAVKEVDADIKYVSPEYFKTLWLLYIQRVKQDPAEVVRIYATKTNQLIRQRFPDWGPPLWVVLVGSYVFLVVGYRRDIWHVTSFASAPIIILLAIAFIGMFIAQGVLAHPSRQYAQPIDGFVLLILAISLEVFFRYSLVSRTAIVKNDAES